MQRTIIDFHTHPFLEDRDNICNYKNVLSFEESKSYLESAGVVKVCGSVLRSFDEPTWADMQTLNDEALKIRAKYPDFYVAGFHIHPKYAKESIAEVERMAKAGVRLVGELVPYFYGWKYSDDGFLDILEAVEHYGLPVNFHMQPEQLEAIENAVKRYPKINFIAAHPGESASYAQHIRLLKEYENYYLDLSGLGLYRFGMLRYGIDQVGADRFLFGTDYPVCNPFTYLGGVENDYTLTEEEKRAVLFDNAQRLLKL
ncbi:MAG: amidohydrolase [Clostridia bacterium]|nr:amidohydrolase [Clostridia bacterium]